MNTLEKTQDRTGEYFFTQGYQTNNKCWRLNIQPSTIKSTYLSLIKIRHLIVQLILWSFWPSVTLKQLLISAAAQKGDRSQCANTVKRCERTCSLVRCRHLNRPVISDMLTGKAQLKLILLTMVLSLTFSARQCSTVPGNFTWSHLNWSACYFCSQLHLCFCCNEMAECLLCKATSTLLRLCFKVESWIRDNPHLHVRCKLRSSSALHTKIRTYHMTTHITCSFRECFLFSVETSKQLF